MNKINPFKPGDKLVCLASLHTDVEVVGNIYTVIEAWAESCGGYVRLAEHVKDMPQHRFDIRRFRAAIKGKDYVDAITPQPNDLYPSGHLADGSSVQKHSAGPLYPYVLVYRDSTDPHSQRKYDIGLIGPAIIGEAWFTSMEHAINATEGLQP